MHEAGHRRARHLPDVRDRCDVRPRPSLNLRPDPPAGVRPLPAQPRASPPAWPRSRGAMAAPGRGGVERRPAPPSRAAARVGHRVRGLHPRERGDPGRPGKSPLRRPGAHRRSRCNDPGPTGDDLAYAEMPAGSAVVYVGSTIHAGGANERRYPARAAHLSYCLGWLRTEENNYLAVPPVVRGEPPPPPRSSSATPCTTASAAAAATSACSACRTRWSSSPEASSLAAPSASSRPARSVDRRLRPSPDGVRRAGLPCGHAEPQRR